MHPPSHIRTRVAALSAVPALLFPLLLGACRTTTPAGPETGPTAATPASGPRDQGAEVRGAEVPTDVPKSEKRYRNTVRWTTASEVDNFGFNVYRSASAEGPFERLNPEIIEGAGTTDEPRRYAFVDDAIDPYETYYYYVESVSMAGIREQFTPIGEAPPKIPPAGSDAGHRR